MKKSILFMYASLMLVIMKSSATTYTEVAGEVSGVWEKTQSPYLVTEPAYIPEGKKLVIEPGVHVFFKQYCGLGVGTKNYWWEDKQPQLIAKGTESDSIVFDVYKQNDFDYWDGINFWGSGCNDTISYAVIRNISALIYLEQLPDNRWTGLNFFNSSPVISNTSIRNNRANIAPLFFITDQSKKYQQQLQKSFPIVRNCIITQNHFFDDGHLFQCNQSNILVENTLICNNTIRHFIMGSDGSIISFISSTIVSNKMIWGGGNLRPISGPSEPKYIYICNSIISQNSTSLHLLFCNLSQNKNDILEIEYSNIDTTIIAYDPDTSMVSSWKNNPVIKWGDGNICAPPMFNDTSMADFTLKANSPCVDAGSPDIAYNDVEDPNTSEWALFPAQGTIRNDMGAYGWKSQLSVKQNPNVGINSNTDILPHSFQLYQNYPNPFNPTTTIPFTLQQTEHVMLKIYNIAGQEVADLVNEVRSGGAYKVEWHAEGLPSGIYFYRLQTGGLLNNSEQSFSVTKKLILQK